MAAKTAETDPAAVKGWIADARKKPISFAFLLGPKGLILQADKVKSPEQMRKAAKTAGGGKGCWGRMQVQQKTLALIYEGNPPGGFEKQVRRFLSDAGVPMQVELTALSAVEADTDEEAGAEEVAAAEAPEDRTGAGPAPVAEADADTVVEEETEEPSDLPTVLKLARKRPLNFACMLSDDGVVLVTHRRKNWNILVKQAKSLGGSAKGAWGTLSVEGKQLVLSCVEDPPGTLAQRLKIKLREEGQKYTVVIRGPAGQSAETEGHVAAGTSDAAREATPGAARSAIPVEEELAQALNAVDRVRGAMSAKQSKMFDVFAKTAREQSASSPSRASATVKLMMQKLDALGLTPADSDTASDAEADGRMQRRASRLSDIAALRSRADALMARILERQT